MRDDSSQTGVCFRVGRAACWGVAALLLCGFAAADKPSRTLIGDTPWYPAPDAVQPKVIYGTDDRIDLYQETDPRRLTWAASTCGLVTQSQLTENLDGTFTIRTSSYGVCPDEPFATQPIAPNCTGFIVGEDLIATAGHCYDTGDIANTRFVFGFAMEDASTPVLNVPADNVYRGIAVVAQVLNSTDDYAIVRVDRPINVAGAVPFAIRREGVVPVGAPVGVIGHPAGLPQKLAFGDTTAVRSNTETGFFVANLDTYGGNSGSPVIDPVTGIVEGILVRGETDFIQDGNCRRSNVVPDGGGRGEDVSKSTRFEQHVPIIVSGNGQLTLDREAYLCSDTAIVVLRDTDLIGMTAVAVAVEADGGDLETLVLAQTDLPGEFAAELTLIGGAPVVDDGTLQLAEGAMFSVTYQDLMHTPGEPDTVVATATADCTLPEVTDVEVFLEGAVFATVLFNTSEPATGNVRVGTTCGGALSTASYVQGTSHVVTLMNLTPSTEYRFHIYARDAAGNETIEDAGGACFSLVTAPSFDYHTEVFSAGSPPDLGNSAILFAPDPAGAGYTVCRESITALSVDDTGAIDVSLSDDGSAQIDLTGGASLVYGGVAYDAVYVNANGNVTFEGSDAAYGQSVDEHFDAPRVSAFFTDLNPAAGGRIWYRQLDDRLAVTWAGIRRFEQTTTNTMQLELFFDGRIRCAYLNITAGAAFVGLSTGLGVMPDFDSSDFSSSGSCSAVGERFHSADVDENFDIDLQELLRVIQFYNLGGYHCDAAGEDGYAAGAGAQGCAPHDSDYDAQDWQMSLSETLRAVQFFNAFGYAYDPDSGSEDGFVPVMAR